MARKYLVLIGDIIGSSSLDERARVQRRFETACRTLNREAAELGIVSPLTITLGDEFQAVFSRPESLWVCLFRLEAALDPVQIRFSLGLGNISTALNRNNALGMDGPAFHAARNGMTLLKQEAGRYRISGLARNDVLTNATLAFIGHHREKWKGTRVKTFAAYLQGMTPKQTSKLLKSTEQAVYKNIRDGALDSLRLIFGEISVQLAAELKA